MGQCFQTRGTHGYTNDLVMDEAELSKLLGFLQVDQKLRPRDSQMSAIGVGCFPLNHESDFSQDCQKLRPGAPEVKKKTAVLGCCIHPDNP